MHLRWCWFYVLAYSFLNQRSQTGSAAVLSCTPNRGTCLRTLLWSEITVLFWYLLCAISHGTIFFVNTVMQVSHTNWSEALFFYKFWTQGQSVFRSVHCWIYWEPHQFPFASFLLPCWSFALSASTACKCMLLLSSSVSCNCKWHIFMVVLKQQCHKERRIHCSVWEQLREIKSSLIRPLTH